MKRLIFMLVFLFTMTGIMAQTQNDAEMADLMRSNGRIYVVIAVMLTILLGLVLYVVRLDKKISKMEKNK